MVSVSLGQSYYTDQRAAQYDLSYQTAYGSAPSHFSPLALQVLATPTTSMTAQFRAEYDTQFHALRTMTANGTVAFGDWLHATAGWSQRRFIQGLPGFNDPTQLDHYLMANTNWKLWDHRIVGNPSTTSRAASAAAFDRLQRPVRLRHRLTVSSAFEGSRARDHRFSFTTRWRASDLHERLRRVRRTSGTGTTGEVTGGHAPGDDRRSRDRWRRVHRQQLRAMPSRLCRLADHDPTIDYAGRTETLADVMDHPRHGFVLGDIGDAAVAAPLVERAEIVVHFAAETHVDRSIQGAGDFIRTDVLGTFVLLEAARRAPRLKRFVQISTDEVYGSVPTGASREADELKPRNPYSASKAGADRLAYSYFATYGLPDRHARRTTTGRSSFPKVAVRHQRHRRSAAAHGDSSAHPRLAARRDHCRALDLLIEKGTDGRNRLGNEDRQRRPHPHDSRPVGRPRTLIRPVQIGRGTIAIARSTRRRCVRSAGHPGTTSPGAWARLSVVSGQQWCGVNQGRIGFKAHDARPAAGPDVTRPVLVTSRRLAGSHLLDLLAWGTQRRVVAARPGPATGGGRCTGAPLTHCAR